MSHSYSHLFNLPITVFRFFTVYGPWGRPDMALFKFTKAILNGEPIHVYNEGNMSRDFTYIDDLVQGVILLIDKSPASEKKQALGKNDSKSPVAPFRLVNIGSARPEKLVDFIAELEKCLGTKASQKLLPLQSGDVLSTWADNKLLTNMTGFSPEFSIEEGIREFVRWYREYYIESKYD